MKRSSAPITLMLVFMVAVLGATPWGSAGFAQPHPDSLQIEFRALTDGPFEAAPAASPRGGFEVELQLDDGSTEGQTGVNGAAAAQFLWFSRFSAQSLDLEEIHVLFPPGANMSVGEPIQLVVYADGNADPTDGATLIATLDETIQAVDGTTFSVFPLAPAVSVGSASSLLIGVIPRFITSGMTSPTLPAAVDTSISQGRAWVALWSGDPPAIPALPSDDTMTLVNGNWMIRAFGTPSANGPVAIEVPALGPWGLGALIALLALLALGRLKYLKHVEHLKRT